MIPRRIIQTHRSPEILRASRETWIAQHPDYEYLFFDDAQCRAFIAERLPALLPTYDRLPLAVQKSDLFRYAAIHELGGIYADVDTECCAPVDSYIDMNAGHFVAGLEMSIVNYAGDPAAYGVHYAAPFQLLQWMFAAPAGHPALAVLLRRIEFLVSQTTPQDLQRFSAQDRFTLELTGPIVFTQVLSDFMSGTRQGPVAVLPRLAWGSWPPEQNEPQLQSQILVKHAFHGGWKTSTVKDGRPVGATANPGPGAGARQTQATPTQIRYDIRR